jgi:hypothetical protein
MADWLARYFELFGIQFQNWMVVLAAIIIAAFLSALVERRR